MHRPAVVQIAEQQPRIAATIVGTADITALQRADGQRAVLVPVDPVRICGIAVELVDVLPCLVLVADDGPDHLLLPGAVVGPGNVPNFWVVIPEPRGQARKRRERRDDGIGRLIAVANGGGVPAAIGRRGSAYRRGVGIGADRVRREHAGRQDRRAVRGHGERGRRESRRVLPDIAGRQGLGEIAGVGDDQLEQHAVAGVDGRRPVMDIAGAYAECRRDRVKRRLAVVVRVLHRRP